MSKEDRLEKAAERTALNLKECEQRYLALFNQARDGIVLIDAASGYIVDCNPEYEKLTGRKLKQLKNLRIWELRPPEKIEAARKLFLEVKQRGKGGSRELEYQQPGGKIVPIDFLTSKVVIGDDKYFQGIVRDISEQKKVEKSIQVSRRFLEIANRHTQMAKLLGEFVSEIKNLTGCAAVGLRIVDKEGKIPYQSYTGFSKEFYELENPLSIKSDQCMCVNVIKGKADSRLSFYTKGGSFYMNATTRFLATVSKEEKGTTRNVCNQFGYETVAVVPIRLGGHILGLIHIADPREDMVPLETVSTLEYIGMQLGDALHRVQVGEELAQYHNRLEEMVKERTGQLTETNRRLKREIKERQEAESALKKSEERYRILFTSGKDAIFAHHPTPDNLPGKFFEVNDVACKMLGYTRKEMYGLSPMDIVAWDKAGLTPKEAMKNLASSGQALIESAFIAKDGRQIPVEVNIHLFELQGQPTVLTVARDITERKKAEEKLRRGELKIRELATAYVRAQEEERQWTALEIHDRIIQPLSAIYQHMQSIQSLVPGSPPTRKALNRSLALIKSTIRETRQVTHDLYPTTLARYGLVRLINDELSQLEKQAGCQTKLSVHGRLQAPQEVETALFRVFHEALLNIRKHANAGNVTVALNSQDGFIELQVLDDGNGFDMTAKTIDKVPGGLESMRRRTEILGGTFIMSSRPGKGTKLNCSIPVAKESK
jgi:PAS domain S-box-containing protein